MSAENREASQKRRFLCRARRKAQEYSESLSSIFNEARREKIPFEAVYPYVNAPKTAFFVYNVISLAFTSLPFTSSIAKPGFESPRGREGLPGFSINTFPYAERKALCVCP